MTLPTKSIETHYVVFRILLFLPLMHSGGGLMSDEDLSRSEILEQLAVLRRRVTELEDRQNVLIREGSALRESEEKYRSIVENLSVGVFISSHAGAFLHANPAVVKMAGYKNVEDFLAVPTEQLYANKSNRGRVLDALHREGSVTNAEMQMLRKDGTVLWVFLSAVLKRDESGNPAWIIGILQDISARKAAQEHLRESEERSRVAFDTSPDAISISRAKDGVYIAVNEGFTLLTGYTNAEVRGKSAAELDIWADPRDRDRLVRGLEKDGYVKNLEARFRLKDGTLRTGLLSARIIMLQAEPHVLSVTRDIEEWKRTKELLQQTEKRYTRLVENTDMGFVRLDSSCRVVDANEPYARMAGAQRIDEVIGRSILDWTAPECLQENAAAVARCVEEGYVSDFETIYLRPDGSRAHILINATIEDGNSGSLITTLCRDVSDRRRAEEERKAAQDKIQEQNEFLTSIIESLPHPFYVVDATQYTIIVANSAAAAVGLAPGSLCYSFTHGSTEPCGRSEDPCPLEEVRATRKPVTVEHVHYDLKGNPRIVQVQAYPIFDATGEVTKVIEYSVDITARKEAEERYLESEERFRKFADEVSFEGIVIHDRGKIMYVNPVFARMYGYEPPELIGMDALETIAPESREIVSRNIRDGHEETYEAMGLRKNGVVFPTEIHARAIPFAGGTMRAAATRDLTKSKQAEKALRESESRFRSLFEAATELIQILDDTGKILEANPAFLKRMGWDHGHVIGKRIDEFFTSSSKKIFHEYFPALLEQGDRTAEFELVAADNKIIIVDCAASAVRDRTGHTKYVVVAQRDITEHKRLEEQLRQAVKMEAIGRLAGGVAHDFNNLLTAIMGYCAMLMQQLPDEGDHVQKLAQINLASERAAALTMQLLAFSRKQVLRMRVVDINGVISEIGDMLRRLIGEHIELVTFLDPELPRVSADQGQIEQIIVNLAVNARDAMPHGGRLSLETAHVTLDDEYAKFHLEVKAGPYVLISVSDSGVGMEADTRSRVFEPFFTTKEKGLGTGLGLSTVYGIVKQHGGHITVYTEPDVGTTFKVYLPRVEDSPDKIPISEVAPEQPGGDETLLIVEDEEIVRNMATEFLQMLGYTILSVGDPEEALVLCAEHPRDIHLLLTDVILPKMDGRMLSRRVSLIRPSLRVLYVSGYTENAIVHHGVLDHGIHFLQKPFSMDALAQKVREVLDA
jgi:two-component system, cell cycle sensor histidine kinase and response regulator CckA